MIPAEYIKTFIPIQELDQVRLSNGIADIRDDDLFLMSQISAYASRDSNAVAVSKKVNYKQLSDKLSNDFSIAGIKLSIDNIHQPVDVLSNDLCAISSFLSSSIATSVDVLSSYSDEICSMV